GVRIARVDGLSDLDVLCGDSPDPHTHLWGKIAEAVDAVWLTERGHEQLRAAVDAGRESWKFHDYRACLRMLRYQSPEIGRKHHCTIRQIDSAASTKRESGSVIRRLRPPLRGRPAFGRTATVSAGCVSPKTTTTPLVLPSLRVIGIGRSRG